MENIYSLTKFANFLIIVIRAEIATTFGSKMVAISARNTMRKFANFVRLYFHTFYYIVDSKILKIHSEIFSISSLVKISTQNKN